jgi:hypothetical protein
LELEFNRNLDWIYLNLIQIQDYNPMNTRLDGFDSGMLHPSPLKEILPQDLEQRGDTKEFTYVSLWRKELWICRTKKFLGFPCSLLLGMTTPLNLEVLNNLMSRDLALLI